MEVIFSGTPTGSPFEMFDVPHVVALSLVVCVNLLVIVFRRWIRQHCDKAFRGVLILLLLGDELAWHVWNAATGQWTVQEMLPLHLCSAMIYLCSVLLLTNHLRLYEFAYLLGIAGALQALLTPNIGAYGYPHFRFFQIVLSHGAIITTAVYLTAVAELRPTSGGALRVILWGNVYMLVVGLVNWLVGSNYLFIARKPETASLLDAFPAWPWYILYIEGLGIFLIFLFYLPFHRRRSSPVTSMAIDTSLSLADVKEPSGGGRDATE